jgi:hypothetical protein
MKTIHTFRLLMLGLILIGPVLVVNAQVGEDDLIIYYSFNSDTVSDADISDVSGNGNDGLIKGNDIASVSGMVGEALEFPGAATDYISVRQHEYVDPFPALTLAAWVKAPGRGMISSWDRSEFFRFAVGDDVGGNNGTTFVAFDHCCPIHDWFGETDVADDEWHHLVAVFDGEEKRIYVDGELDASTDATTEVIGAGQSRFGFIGIGSEAPGFDGATGPTWAFIGLMDEYLMFHRPLSEAEIEHLASGPSDPFAEVTAVDPNGKLSTTWGNIKVDR